MKMQQTKALKNRKNFDLTVEESRDKKITKLLEAVTQSGLLIRQCQAGMPDEMIMETLTKLNAATARALAQIEWHNFFWNADGTRKVTFTEPK